jgi:hypothetical protein
MSNRNYKGLSKKNVPSDGSNPSGTYVKLSDGTMIEFGQSNSGSVTFPQEFISNPYVFTNFLNGNAALVMNSYPTSITTSGFAYAGHYLTKEGYALNDYLSAVQWFAVGRWK